MDIGTAKPTPAERAEVPHHCLDLVDPDVDFSVTMFQEAGDQALGELAARAARPLLVAGTGLYLRVLIDGFDPPGQWPDVRSELETGARHGRAAPPPRRGGPGGGRPHGAVQPASGRAGPRGHDRERTAVLVVRPRPHPLPGQRHRPDRTALAAPGPGSPDRGPVPGHARRRPDGRGPGAGRATGRPVPDRRAGPRVQGAAGPSRRRVARWTRPPRSPSPAPGSSPCASSAGSSATPAYAGWRWTRTGTTPVTCWWMR